MWLNYFFFKFYCYVYIQILLIWGCVQLNISRWQDIPKKFLFGKISRGSKLKEPTLYSRSVVLVYPFPYGGLNKGIQSQGKA